MKEDLLSLDKSIGIICFNNEYYDGVNNIFSRFIDQHAIPAERFIKLDDKSRISYLPTGVYLTEFKNCKGLEFSRVYVLGLSLDDISNFNDAKKAFVAVTRAMNSVVIYS